MNGEEKPEKNFRKFQMISYEFGQGQDLFQLTKNFGSKELIIASKRNNNFVKIPFDAMDIFIEYMNQLAKEQEKV